jgi:hypothetical protein
MTIKKYSLSKIMVCRAFKSCPPIKMEQYFLIVLKDFFEGAPKEVINVSLHSKTFLADCFSPVNISVLPSAEPGQNYVDNKLFP